MLTTAILGVASSIATELVKWLNRKITWKPLAGQAALLLSIVLALVAGFVRIVIVDVPLAHIWNVETFIALSVTAFGWSQLYFRTLAKWFGLTSDQPSD
jgi:uncharacterized membrane protein HdeD (DUF308 family)